jgi:hypothetical protein
MGKPEADRTDAMRDADEKMHLARADATDPLFLISAVIVVALIALLFIAGHAAMVPSPNP